MPLFQNLCLLVGFIFGISALSAETIVFKRDKQNNLMEWKQDKSQQFQPLGEALAVESENIAAIRLKSAGPPVVLIYQKAYTLKPGKVLRLSFSVSGNGSVNAGGYFYNKTWKYLGSCTKKFDVGKSEKKYEVIIHPSSSRIVQDPDFVTLLLATAGWRSDITIRNVSVETVDPADIDFFEDTEQSAKQIPVSKISSEKLLGTGFKNFTAVIPETHKTPVIDGKIDDSEWNRSLKLMGFIRSKDGLLPNESGTVYAMRDMDFLYLAVRCSAPNNDPGAGLVSKASERDSAVYDDDSVEFMLQPDSDSDTCYHVIVNSNGVIYDRKVTYLNQGSDVRWNLQGVKVGTRAESSIWDLEIQIPLKEIGNPQKFLKMNIARNWYNYGATAINPTALHVDRTRMGHFALSDKLPVIRMHEIGNPTVGKWNVKMEAYNPSMKTFLFAGMLRSYELQKKGKKTEKNMLLEYATEKEIAPGTSAELTFSFNADSPDTRYLSCVIFDPVNDEIAFSRLLTAKKEQFRSELPGLGIFELKKFGSVACWYYPSINKARLQFYMNPPFKRAELTADFGAEKIKTTRGADGTTALVAVPSQEGKHSFHLSIREENGKTTELNSIFHLTKKHYPWENNSLGKEKIILPPFTPISLEGKKISVILREHTINGSGLWDSLKAQGKELLAGPMRWELVVDGKLQKWNTASPVLQTVDGGYAATGNAEIKSDSGIVLNSKIKFEYDGFFWSDTTLKNTEGKVVNRLTLVIPLNDAEMPLFHVISNTIRSNPGGRIPAGEGEVWNGAELKRSGNSIHPQLVPHIWLGGVERGLTWFTDSSYGYRLRKDRGSLRLNRKNGILYMEVDIINRPVSLKDAHTFSFGMQATPVKPMEKIWSRQTYDTTGVGVKGMQNVQCLNESILGFPLQWAKVPEGEDYSLLHSMAEASRSGKQINAMEEQRKFRSKYDHITLRKIDNTPKISSWDGVKYFSSVRDNFVKICMNNPARTPSLPYKYSDPRLIYIQDEVPQYFKSEWWISNTNYFGAWRSYPVPSNLDYMIYGYYNEIKHGMHGVYLDDVFLMPNTNTDTVARTDDEGEKHSQIGILALRELIKRIAVIQHQFGRYPRVLQVHMTNAQLIPCFAFATSQLAWESMFGETPLPERYTLDNVQAEGIGLRLGVDSVALGGILRKTTARKDWPAKKAQLSRSFLALSLPHGVKVWNRISPDDIDWKTVQSVYRKMSEFGYGNTDCDFLPYWEKRTELQASPEQVIVSAYRRSGKILLVVANLKNTVTASLKLDFKKLGIPYDASIVNLETNTPENPYALKLGAYDFKLLQIGK